EEPAAPMEPPRTTRTRATQATQAPIRTGTPPRRRAAAATSPVRLAPPGQAPVGGARSCCSAGSRGGLLRGLEPRRGERSSPTLLALGAHMGSRYWARCRKRLQALEQGGGVPGVHELPHQLHGGL